METVVVKTYSSVDNNMRYEQDYNALRAVHNASSEIYKCHIDVISILFNLAEVVNFMPQHTPSCAIHLPIALTV